MIILRKIGVSNTNCKVVLSDLLSGVVDGNNQTFTVSYEYTPGEIEIIFNGQTLVSSVDFEETGPNEITFIFVKPVSSDVLVANYNTVDCQAGSNTFTDLNDTPSSYTGQAGKFLRVNSTETGIEFISVGDTQEGITTLSSGIYYTTINFDRDFSSANYVLTMGLENSMDVDPSIFPSIIKEKTVSGFSVYFSGEIDSDNYSLNWRASLSGISYGGSGDCTCSGINEVVEDTSPELGGDLSVGNHLIMLDTVPSGMNIHGYTIGYSGEASEMYVDDNPTGFACPLYMKSNGHWAACTAVSGTTQMPCSSLALEEDDGAIKKILWGGIIRKSNWNWIPGNKIYVSTVEGALTNTKPTGGAWPQVIGVAIASDAIKFSPDLGSENPN